jgi:hypothetical protein
MPRITISELLVIQGKTPEHFKKAKSILGNKKDIIKAR